MKYFKKLKKLDAFKVYKNFNLSKNASKQDKIDKIGSRTGGFITIVLVTLLLS